MILGRLSRGYFKKNRVLDFLGKILAQASLTLLNLINCTTDSTVWLVAKENPELIFAPSSIILSKTSKLFGTEDS